MRATIRLPISWSLARRFREKEMDWPLNTGRPSTPSMCNNSKTTTIPRSSFHDWGTTTEIIKIRPFHNLKRSSRCSSSTGLQFAPENLLPVSTQWEAAFSPILHFLRKSTSRTFWVPNKLVWHRAGLTLRCKPNIVGTRPRILTYFKVMWLMRFVNNIKFWRSSSKTTHWKAGRVKWRCRLRDRIIARQICRT